MKDFLFFNYSWVKNSTFLFESFAKKGHTIDIVDETNIFQFKPQHSYKNVVLYLHEPNTIPVTNALLDTHLKDAVLIQHDTTDEEHVQKWSNRKPDLIMQRELTTETQNPWGSPILPFHFAIQSIEDGNINDKSYDISLMATMTNPRRAPFVKHAVELAKGPLSHLKWYIEVTPRDVRTPDKYREVCNKSKIGLHYFGNSYDSIRIWELASCKAAIIMPHMRNLSVSDEYTPFRDYCIIRDDFQDLEEKILYMLEENRYKEYAEKAYLDYENIHKPEKYFEYYYSQVMKYAKK